MRNTIAAMHRAAVFSSCHQYRYALWRRWTDGPQVLFVMLNPSTADEHVDDPTIRRCIGLAQRWGYGALTVGNLFAYRTSSPVVLKHAESPIGELNDEWLCKLQQSSTITVAAWGNHGVYLKRSDEVRRMLKSAYTLGLTQLGQPRHPLYVANTSQSYLWLG